MTEQELLDELRELRGYIAEAAEHWSKDTERGRLTYRRGRAEAYRGAAKWLGDLLDIYDMGVERG